MNTDNIHADVCLQGRGGWLLCGEEEQEVYSKQKLLEQ